MRWFQRSVSAEEQGRRRKREAKQPSRDEGIIDSRTRHRIINPCHNSWSKACRQRDVLGCRLDIPVAEGGHTRDSGASVNVSLAVKVKVVPS